MSGSSSLLLSLSSRGARRATWRDRWQLVRELVGGVLVIVVWIALFTGVWAAIDGPLSPVRRDPTAAAVSDVRT